MLLRQHCLLQLVISSLTFIDWINQNKQLMNWQRDNKIKMVSGFKQLCDTVFVVCMSLTLWACLASCCCSSCLSNRPYCSVFFPHLLSFIGLCFFSLSLIVKDVLWQDSLLDYSTNETTFCLQAEGCIMVEILTLKCHLPWAVAGYSSSVSRRNGLELIFHV